MNTRVALSATLAVLTLVSTMGVAGAQPKPGRAAPTKPAAPAKPAPDPSGSPPLSESLSAEPKADYDAARLLYGNGDFGGALVKFSAAYEKSKDPRLLWNIAACEKNLHHYSSVLAYLRRYLAEGGGVLSEAERLDAEALIKAIQPLTSALEVSVSESGARVYVNDTLVGETPLPAPVSVDVGPCRIRVEKDGFEPYREEVTIGNTPHIKIVAHLEKSVTDATVVIYTARPLDDIYIDGALRGAGTWRGSVPGGTHTLRVTGPGMHPHQSDFVVHDRESKTIALTLDQEPSKPSARVPSWVWIGGAAVVVAVVVVGGYFLFKPDDVPPQNPVGTLDPGSVQASLPYAPFTWR